jgi:hypothetical protein
MAASPPGDLSSITCTIGGVSIENENISLIVVKEDIGSPFGPTAKIIFKDSKEDLANIKPDSDVTINFSTPEGVSRNFKCKIGSAGDQQQEPRGGDSSGADRKYNEVTFDCSPQYQPKLHDGLQFSGKSDSLKKYCDNIYKEIGAGEVELDEGQKDSKGFHHICSNRNPINALTEVSEKAEIPGDKASACFVYMKDGKPVISSWKCLAEKAKKGGGLEFSQTPNDGSNYSPTNIITPGRNSIGSQNDVNRSDANARTYDPETGRLSNYKTKGAPLNPKRKPPNNTKNSIFGNSSKYNDSTPNTIEQTAAERYKQITGDIRNAPTQEFTTYGNDVNLGDPISANMQSGYERTQGDPNFNKNGVVTSITHIIKEIGATPRYTSKYKVMKPGGPSG